MADVTLAQEVFFCSVTVAAVDNNNVLQTRSKEFEFDATITDYAAASTALGTLVTALDAINEADIVEKSIRSVFRHNGTAVTVVGNPRKEAQLSLRPSSGGNLMSHSIFSPSDALVAGKNVVETLAALLTYLDLFEATGPFRMSDGESIAATNQIASSRVRHVTGPKS